jgi:hypothetical protein
MFYKQIQMLKPRRSPRVVTRDTKTGANPAAMSLAAPPEQLLTHLGMVTVRA